MSSLLKFFGLLLSLYLTGVFSLAPNPPAGYLLTPVAPTDWGQLTVGDTITAHGEGFGTGNSYRIQLRSGSTIDLATVTADRNGSFQVALTMPQLAIGRYLVVACAAGSSSDCPVTAQATLVLT
ncbi:MAG: hypothetical protein ACRDWH_02160, partial [Acidimicrobiia bacterium]